MINNTTLHIHGKTSYDDNHPKNEYQLGNELQNFKITGTLKAYSRQSLSTTLFHPQSWMPKSKTQNQMTTQFGRSNMAITTYPKTTHVLPFLYMDRVKLNLIPGHLPNQG